MKPCKSFAPIDQLSREETKIPGASGGKVLSPRPLDPVLIQFKSPQKGKCWCKLASNLPRRTPELACSCITRELRMPGPERRSAASNLGVFSSRMGLVWLKARQVLEEQESLHREHHLCRSVHSGMIALNPVTAAHCCENLKTRLSWKPSHHCL